jgi:hypothetical protein
VNPPVAPLGFSSSASAGAGGPGRPGFESWVTLLCDRGTPTVAVVSRTFWFKQDAPGRSALLSGVSATVASEELEMPADEPRDRQWKVGYSPVSR